MSCPTLVKSAVISALAGFCLVSSAQDHELTTDVVVIGGGISGLSSAMSVLDHGGKVAVLEKLPGLGGAGNYFEGAFAADSDYKRRNGLKEPTADQVYKDVVRFYNYRINAVVLRTLINESGPAMDWIETKGYKFQLNPNNLCGNFQYLPPLSLAGTRLPFKPLIALQHRWNFIKN